jgi:hypothetical protein
MTMRTPAKSQAKQPASTCSRLNAHGLTLTQQSAVDLLAAGKNDTETAAALGLNRVTVTRWRLYSPEFRGVLTEQRAAIWGAAADRLRALLPKALDTLAEALERGDDKVTVALAVLKLAGPLPLVSAGPTDPEEIVRDTVERERERISSRSDELDGYAGLPDYDDHMKTVRKRLARLAGPAEGEPTFRPSDEPR